MDTFPYLGSLITEGGECTMEFRTRLNTGQVIGASLQKIWKSHSIPISAKIRLMKALVWPVATYGCESGHSETHTHTHPFNGPFFRTTRVSRYQKGKPIWILLKQETTSGSGISWAVCKSAPCSRQITTPATHHFLQPGCPSCRPTNSVKALKA